MRLATVAALLACAGAAKFEFEDVRVSTDELIYRREGLYGGEGHAYVAIDLTVRKQEPHSKNSKAQLFVALENEAEQFGILEPQFRCRTEMKKQGFCRVWGLDLSPSALANQSFLLTREVSFDADLASVRVKARVKAETDGMHYVGIAALPPVTGGVIVSGTVDWISRFGHLQGELLGAIPLYALLTLLYLCLTLCWLYQLRRHWQHVLRLQMLLFSAILLSLILAASCLIFYVYTDLTVTVYKSSAAQLFEPAAISVSRVLLQVSCQAVLLMAGYGYGVVVTKLSLRTRVFVGLWSAATMVSRCLAVLDRSPDPTDTFSFLLFCFWLSWLMYTIGDTTAALEREEAEGGAPSPLRSLGSAAVGGVLPSTANVKLRLFKRMRRSLKCYSLLLILIGVCSVVPRFLEMPGTPPARHSLRGELSVWVWAWAWAALALYDIGAAVVLVSLALVWMPSPQASQYAPVQQHGFVGGSAIGSYRIDSNTEGADSYDAGDDGWKTKGGNVGNGRSSVYSYNYSEGRDVQWGGDEAELNVEFDTGLELAQLEQDLDLDFVSSPTSTAAAAAAAAPPPFGNDIQLAASTLEGGEDKLEDL